MQTQELIRRRVANHYLAGPLLDTPHAAVEWQGAVQAQDYSGARWALGLRLSDSSPEAVDQALANGSIIRTHILRPTWHFVSPRDIRWMMELTAPRVKIAMAPYDRELGWDAKRADQASEIIARALQGGKQLTRAEIGALLDEAGVCPRTELRTIGHAIIRAELDLLICSGALKGKQHTFALLDERVPKTAAVSRQEALARLTLQFFRSHGPATSKDFRWWSSLTMADIKEGLALVGSKLVAEAYEGQEYWFDPNLPVSQPAFRAHLLPNYDEYVVAYAGRELLFDERHTELFSRGNPLFTNVILLDGRIVGTWRRTVKKSDITVDATLFVKLAKGEIAAIEEAAKRYGVFMGVPVRLVF